MAYGDSETLASARAAPMSLVLSGLPQDGHTRVVHMSTRDRVSPARSCKLNRDYGVLTVQKHCCTTYDECVHSWLSVVVVTSGLEP